VIPVFDLKAQYAAIGGEVQQAVQRVLESGWYVLGREVAAFEEEFAAYVGVRHGIGVASGTEALQVGLMACGIGAGDEVITVSHTASATAMAVLLAGATPVFVDIDPATYTMRPELVETALTVRTKAVLPVHLYGQPADMAAVMDVARRHGLRVIEDCAQAHGATYRGQRVGAFGDLGCFSFYPTKNLGAYGDGGIVVTNDDALAEQVRLVREYGWRRRYVSEQVGLNSRLDEVQAAVLRVKLRYLDDWNAARRQRAARYGEALAGAPGIERHRLASTSCDASDADLRTAAAHYLYRAVAEGFADRVDRAVQEAPTLVDEQDAVTQRLRIAHVVGAHDHGRATVALLDQQALEHRRVDRVEALERLVDDEQIGRVDDRRDELRLLVHAA